MNSRSLAFIWLPGFIFLTVISTYAQPVPEEAKRFYARGQAALEMATTPADYDSAIVQFTNCLLYTSHRVTPPFSLPV